MSRNQQENAGTQSVLIIAEETGFARDLMARWQAEVHVPQFTTIAGDLWEHAQVAGCDLVVVGRVPADILDRILTRASSVAAVLVVLPAGASPHQVRAACPNVVPLRGAPDVVETAVIVGTQLLARTAVERQLDRAQKAATDSEMQAALGRYMIESRYSFNNALTAVLGTAELMQLDQQLPRPLREQVETIHVMALRLHGMMQRFTSLEAEVQSLEREPRPLVPLLRFERDLSSSR
jgi:hypothetical protein